MIEIIIKNFNDKIKVCVDPEQVKLLVKKTAKELEQYIIQNKNNEL